MPRLTVSKNLPLPPTWPLKTLFQQARRKRLLPFESFVSWVVLSSNSTLFPLLSRRFKNVTRSISFRLVFFDVCPTHGQAYSTKWPLAGMGLHSPWWPQTWKKIPLFPESLEIPGKEFWLAEAGFCGWTPQLWKKVEHVSIWDTLGEKENFLEEKRKALCYQKSKGTTIPEGILKENCWRTRNYHALSDPDLRMAAERY